MSSFLRSLIASRYSGSSKARNTIVGILAWVAAALYLPTVWFLLARSGTDNATKASARAILILWTVIPPAWFWIEYHLIWLTANPKERGEFDEFKHAQETGRNIWLALVAVLAGLYFK
jgi:hypothetical protein